MTTFHMQPSATLDWEGNFQVDDRPGQAFQGSGGILHSIDVSMGTDEGATTDGTYLMRVYEAEPTAYPVDPVPAEWTASTAYSLNDIVRPTSEANGDVHFVFRCATAGTSGGTEPTWPGAGGVSWTTITEGGTTNDNTVVWETVYCMHPTNPALPANTPTPDWLAESDSYAYAPGTNEAEFKTLSFSGANRIRLEDGKWYVFVMQWQANSSGVSNLITVYGENVPLDTPTHPGNCYLDGSSVNNNGPRIIEDLKFRVREEFVLLDKVSGTDSGFSGSPDSTDPFTSGQQVSFTVQAGDTLTDNVTYYWRVRGIDPSGSNTYGAWATTRSFDVSVTNTVNMAAIIAAVISTADTTSLDVSRSFAAAIGAATSTTDVATLSLSRLFAAAILAATTTPDDVTIQNLLSFAATLAAATTTSDDSVLGLASELAAAISSATSTPDAVTLEIARALTAIIGGAITTSDTPELTISGIVELAATIVAATITSDISVLGIQRPFGATIDAVISTTDDLSLTVLRELAATLSAVTSTPDDVSLLTLKAMSAVIAVATSVNDAVALEILRAFAGVIAASTSTPDDLTLDISGFIELAAAILGATSTPDDVSITVERLFAASLDAVTLTTDVATLDIAGFITLAASIVAQTTTTDVATLSIAKEFAAAIQMATSTNDAVNLLTGIVLSASILAQTSTPDDVALALSKAMSANIIGSTSTPDDANLTLSILLAASVLAQTSTNDLARLSVGAELVEMLYKGLARGMFRGMR